MNCDETSLHKRTEILWAIHKHGNTDCRVVWVDEIFIDHMQNHFASGGRSQLFTCPCFETAKNNYRKGKPGDDEGFLLNLYIPFKSCQSTKIIMIATKILEITKILSEENSESTSTHYYIHRSSSSSSSSSSAAAKQSFSSFTLP
jgi:hypothetical protein